MRSIFGRKRSRWQRKPRILGRRRFLPAMERLEPRNMLAGNVTAVVTDGGDLILTGDAESNSVDVVIVGGDLVVQGRDNTTVNGGNTPFVAFAGSTVVADDFFADLGAGSDVLFVDGVTITDRATVESGEGDNSIGFLDTTFGTDLRIRTRRGADIVNLDGLHIGRDLIVRTAKQLDVVRIANSDITDDLAINTGKAGQYPNPSP